MNAPAPHGAPRPEAPSRDGNWDDGWSSPTSFRFGTPAVEPVRMPVRKSDRRDDRPGPQQAMPAERPSERGLPGWGALLLLIAIAGIGGIIDVISGSQVRGGFNWGIIVASVVAILAVRRSGMFPVVIAPPIVYSAGSGAMLYIRSSGLHDRRVLFDAAANWLVYGFPAIAGASAAVLIIAGVRMLARR